MDSSEKLVEAYLAHLGVGDVTYEPDGNVPPDFLVDGRIAVEVRRLNQNYEKADGFEGIESAEAALIRYFRKLLPTYGPSADGKGWWVFFYFWRPLEWKAVKTEVREVLAAIKLNPPSDRLKVRLSQNMELEIAPATIPRPTFYGLGGLADRDSGGFVASEIMRNLGLCIAEKARKIAPYRSRYPEWWLVLPDHIGPELDKDERDRLPGSIPLLGWDRVVLLNPNDHTRALEM